MNKSHQKPVKLTNCLYNLIINFLRNRQTGSASCTDNLCTPGESDFVMKGLGIPDVYIDLSFTDHMMWRREACFQNDDKDCFECKPFDEKVKTCTRGLVLRNGTIFCDSGLGLNSVLGTECSQDSDGRCLDVARPPTQIPRSPLENLCRKYPREDICNRQRGRGDTIDIERSLDIEEDDVLTTTPGIM